MKTLSTAISELEEYFREKNSFEEIVLDTHKIPPLVYMMQIIREQEKRIETLRQMAAYAKEHANASIKEHPLANNSHAYSIIRAAEIVLARTSPDKPMEEL